MLFYLAYCFPHCLQYEQMLTNKTRVRHGRGRPRKNMLKARKVPAQARSQETVTVILEASARILEADGLRGFNTNAIAERAGVSVGSLYQYFPNTLHFGTEWPRSLPVAPQSDLVPVSAIGRSPVVLDIAGFGIGYFAAADEVMMLWTSSPLSFLVLYSSAAIASTFGQLQLMIS